MLETGFMLTIVLATFALAGVSAAQGAVPRSMDFTQDTTAQKDARMKWFREGRYGMFIHWGLYAIPAGVWQGKNYAGASEWLLNTAQIKVSDYTPLLAQFNPVDFDAEEWVKIAKAAGVKYIVITSKHHDGFALYPSNVSEWDVESSPFRRDILKELSEACRNAGIVFCTYHSIMDWHHPDYIPRRSWDPRPEHKPDFDRYVAYMKAQLAEIVKRYDPGIMWFDGEWEETWNHERGVDLYNYVRSLKPSILVNNRVDKGRAGMAGMTVGDHLGDFGTPEQEIPANGFPGVDWESCMTMNDSWGFHQNDPNWKSAEMLLRNLIDCVSKGGNYLLNVGPTALGKIPPESVERLSEVGEWLKVNGESIYGAKASPFPRPLKWGRVTSKPGKLYLHVFDTNAESLTLPGLSVENAKAYLLLNPKTTLKVDRNRDGFAVQAPRGTKPGTATVVVLEIKGEPRVVIPPLRQSANGEIELRAIDAAVEGHTARYEDHRDAIGFWNDIKDKVAWSFEVTKPGLFKVFAEVASLEGTAGSTISIEVGSQSVRGTIPKTKSWDDFVTLELGTIEILAKGTMKLTVSPIEMPKWAVCNLRSVRLVPK